MTKDEIIYAIDGLTGPDDLLVIARAAHRRIRNLEKQQEEEKYQEEWKRAKCWDPGTIIYPFRTIEYLFGNAKFSISRGERLIVRKRLPRARALGVERPDRPEWKGKMQRVDVYELCQLDCRLDDPSSSEMIIESAQTKDRTSAR